MAVNIVNLEPMCYLGVLTLVNLEMIILVVVSTVQLIVNAAYYMIHLESVTNLRHKGSSPRLLSPGKTVNHMIQLVAID